MRRIALSGKKIYTTNGIKSGAVVMDGGKITKIISDLSELGHDAEIVDVGENWIIPGLIDIHIHGCGGWAIGGPGSSDVKGMARYLASKGITSFQPTTDGGTVDEIKNALKALREAMNSSYSGARILGIHMEGPFLNSRKKGAFSAETLLEPSVELMKEFIDTSGNSIIHVTLAPELKGAGELISFLTSQNILASAGHTDANIDEIKKAVEEGIRLSNHTCNAQRAINHRDPGALGGLLLDDRIDCELICDFFHVHPDMIRLIVKLKTIDKICMISDSILASGIEPGEYNFPKYDVIIDSSGGCRLKDGTIAGSTKNLMTGVKNMVEGIGYPMEDVLKMASYNPARISGFADRKGSIEVGKDADLVVIDEDFDVKYTFVEGSLVFDSHNKQHLTKPLS